MKQRLGLAFLGLVCLAFAVFVAWIFGSATVITCTRVEPAQVNCTVQETFLGWLPLGEPQTLRYVRSASLDITAASNDDGFSGLYLVLNAENGKLRMYAFSFVSRLPVNGVDAAKAAEEEVVFSLAGYARQRKNNPQTLFCA